MFYGGVRQQHTAVQDSGDSDEVSDKEEKSRIVDDRFTCEVLIDTNFYHFSYFK